MQNLSVISILLICRAPKKYRLVMKQLAQDGWQVSSVSNIKKALQMIATEPPTHVFISANTPGISLLKIAKIITTSFNLPVILFSEIQDAQTLKIMRTIAWPHTLSSISAAQIRNKIRMLMGDNMTVSTAESNSNPTHSTSSSQSERSDFQFQGKKIKKISDEEPELNNEEQEVIYSEEDLASEDKSPEVVSFGVDGEIVSPYDINSTDSEIESLLDSFDESGDPVSAKKDNDIDETEMLLAELEGRKPISKKASAPKETNVVPITSSTIVKNKKEKEVKALEDLPYTNIQHLPVPDKVKEIVEETLYKVVTPSAKTITSVEKTSDFIAFYIESQDFAGVIYIAVGKNSSISSGIIGGFMKTLADSLLASKIEAYVHRPVSIHTDPFDIKTWVKEKCNFSFTTTHNGDEVLLGFLSDNEIQPRFQDSEYGDMFHVDISHFPVSYPMNMDLFVYLPLNKKAVKYITKGGYLEKRQKDRLQKNKVNKLHVLHKDILLVRDFFIKLYTKKKMVK